MRKKSLNLQGYPWMISCHDEDSDDNQMQIAILMKYLEKREWLKRFSWFEGNEINHFTHYC